MRRPYLIAATLFATTALAAVLWLGGREAGPGADDPAGILLPEKPVGPLADLPLPSGSGTVLPMGDPDQAFSADGLKAIRDFAAASNSTALLVWHAGALQLEIYAPGVQAGDMLDGTGLVPGLMALLTGLAQRDGVVPGLETEVAAWLPEWAGDDRGRVTVRHLLEGTSGLDAPAVPPGPDAIAWTLSARLVAEPGSRFDPHGVEMQVLGVVLARAAGVPVADYLSERLWRPMGPRPGLLAAGSGDGAAYLQCCVRATARDWLRPGLLLLEGGMAGNTALVPAPWLDQMQRPIPHSRHDGLRTRMAWPFEAKNGNGARKPFADGDTIFWSGDDGARLYVSRGRELVILRLGPAAADWDESALPNLVSKAIITPPAELRSVNGLSVRRARDLNGKVDMPPIVKPPAVPKVTVEPLAPLEGEAAAPPAP